MVQRITFTCFAGNSSRRLREEFSRFLKQRGHEGKFELQQVAIERPGYYLPDPKQVFENSDHIVDFWSGSGTTPQMMMAMDDAIANSRTKAKIHKIDLAGNWKERLLSELLKE